MTKKISEWVNGHAWLAVGIAMVPGLGIGAAGAKDTTEDDETPVSASETVTTTTLSEETPTTTIYEAPVVEDPEVTYTQTCDYLLPDDYYGGTVELVGDSKVQNTGNVGAIGKVLFKWNQTGAAPIKTEKKFRVERGRTTRVRVNLKFPYDGEGGNIIDRIQSLPYGDQCKVKATITDTFGEPQ